MRDLPDGWAVGVAVVTDSFRGNIMPDASNAPLWAEGVFGDGVCGELGLDEMELVGDEPELGALIEAWVWVDSDGEHERGIVTRRRLSDGERRDLGEWLALRGVEVEQGG